MNILNEAIPGHWPAEAKTLVNDLRRAYRALEKEFAGYDDRVTTALSEDDEIARECALLRLTAQESLAWRVYRQNTGRVVSPDQMLRALYTHESDAACSKIVDVLALKLRRKLKNHNFPFVIETQHGLGKRVIDLNEKIREVESVPEAHHPLLKVKIGSFVAQDDIRKLCWASEVKYSELSRVFGLSKKTVGAWVGGHEVMPVKYGTKLANFFKGKQAALIRAAGGKPRLAA